MSGMQKTQKICENGHEMDPVWEVCPYCPSDRRSAAGNPALARTIKVDDYAAPPPPSPPTAPAPRRTEIMDVPPGIDAIGWFVATTGDDKGTAHRISGDRTTIGAAMDCDVEIHGAHVSDRHASLRFREGEFTLTDLDSTNGTFVNGDRISQRKLEDGDRVGFGSTQWVFKYVVFES
ncbi:hypothetical protein BH23GEM9_BH23GEM9_25970 [soil metagenome]